jgi:hypothetical protein
VVARLPSDGGDANIWGALLNEFLKTAHLDNGAIRTVPEDLGVPLTLGEATFPRQRFASPGATTSGDLQLTYFTACKTETVTQLAMYSAGTAAATVTLNRWGVYNVAANGDLTLTASTPNDTTLFTATSTRYVKSLSVPWSKVAGNRYAVGFLTVATTPPSVYGSTDVSTALADTVWGRDPRLSGRVTGQTDLPASVAAASVVDSRRNPFVECLL